MKTVRTWCIRILMILFTVIFLYPLFWNLMSAFKTNAEYLTDPYALPAALNLDTFLEIIASTIARIRVNMAIAMAYPKLAFRIPCLVLST